MKVFILTEGGSDIGFGHITRCISLYQAFKERGIIPWFIVNGDESVKDLLIGKNCTIFNWLEKQEKLIELLKEGDITIIDSYLADFELYKKISEVTKIPVYIDDTKRIDYPKGIVVNGGINAERLNYPIKDDVKYLLGTEYIPLRKEFHDVPAKEIKDNIESIMITMGGNDIKNITPKILRILTEDYPNIVKKVVIGKGFTNIEDIERVKDSKTELLLYPDAEGMRRIMFESDIAISAGGQTLYELASVGVPTVAVAVADNQLNNVKEWREVGLVGCAGWWNDKELLNNILACIANLESNRNRLKRSLIGRKLVDGMGCFRIIDYLKNEIKTCKKFLKHDEL